MAKETPKKVTEEDKTIKQDRSHEMPKGERSGTREPMYGGPKMTPGNKRVPTKKRGV